ncbi:short transient receptor potential channel 4-like [Lycorma delicatula]|uniref:short transient receptor potential channel 4-like n=1 Tax=Lycorma delicatula TaxID=130591 RepID=UPI003F510C08
MAYRTLDEDYDDFETEEEEERLRAEREKQLSQLENIPINNELYSKRNYNVMGHSDPILSNLQNNKISGKTEKVYYSNLPDESPDRHHQNSTNNNFRISRYYSVYLPELLVSERHFFKLVEEGDVEKVKEFLQESSMFNINCSDFQGLTALHIAMQARNDDMVDFLLQQKRLDVTDSALHAIMLDQPHNLIKILDRLKEVSPELEYTGCIYSPDFSMNMTPLILAAQCGNYEIIRILLARGHSIPRPHKPCCLCPEECLKILQSEDALLMIVAILDVYRAISNPAYICHISSDPILYAFELSDELVKCAYVHAIFQDEFLQICEDVKTFAAEFMSCCRSCEEATTVLNQEEGSRTRGHLLFPRLILAMTLKQKQFVATHCVQQVLEIACIGDWYEWKCYPLGSKILTVFPRIIILPAIVFLCLVAPKSKLVQHYSLPINRMISHSASYLVFLILLFMQSNKDKTDQRKNIQFTGLEIPIALFVIGLIWVDIRLLILQGYDQYTRFRWNVYNMICDLVFILHYMFFISAYFQVMMLSEEERELERKYWHYLDPQLIAEVFFGVATIMSYAKLLLIIQVHSDIGPLQVALGKMMCDCARYAVLFIVVIMAFNAGLCKLYNYYADMYQMDPDTQVVVRQEPPFTNPFDTLKFLFWGLFGVSDPDNAKVVIENIQGEGGKTIMNEHYITEALGYYSFAIFMVLTVIIVLNMMIATMANTYQQVVNNVGVEWVFGRTEVNIQFVQLFVVDLKLIRGDQVFCN